MMPGLFSDYGGFNPNAVREVCGLFGVSEGQQPIIYDKVLRVVTAITEIRDRNRKEKEAKRGT